MEKIFKCFIKRKDNTYEEITYKELELRRRTKPSYKEKYFIYIHKMLMEVSHEDYIEYHRERERNRYAKSVTEKLSAFSIESLNAADDGSDFNDKDVLTDTSNNVEEIALKNIEIKKLNEALLLLTEVEIQIINAIFYKEKTLREYAKSIGIPHSTLEYREKIILEKLKKLINL